MELTGSTEKLQKISNHLSLIYLVSGNPGRFLPNAQRYPANNSKLINNNIQEFLLDLYETRIDTCWYR